MDRSLRSSPRIGFVSACLSAALVLSAATPAAAEHAARLSADLQGHLAAGSQSIEIIVHGSRQTCDGLATTYNLVVKRYLTADGCIFRVNAGQLAALQQDQALDHISGNIRIKSLDEVTAEAIGADQVWAGVGDLPKLNGQHVTVAVIDSGIDITHAALRNRVIATKDFTGGDGSDRFGHGTHVAGIIAGQQVATPDGHDYRGIASGAYLVNLRVLGDDGSGTVGDVVDAVDWAIEHREQYKIRIINLSLGAPVLQPYRDDPLCEAVERAVRAGITVVAAAGNFGTVNGKTALGLITSPGNSPHVITVGAIDTHATAARPDDTLATWSSRGPTRYDLILKPDVAAPGSHIASAEAQDSYLANTYPQRHVTGAGTNAIIQLSGTSMACGVVSGAAALLIDERSNLRPTEAKAVLQLTSSFIQSAGLLGAGAGEINILAAAEFAENEVLPLATVISHESITPSRVAYGVDFVFGVNARLVRSSRARGTTIFWGTAARTFKGASTDGTIFWGTSADGTIFWGTSADDTIFWGTSANDTIFWGTSADDTIFWGTAADDTIFWGTAADDTIFWGTAVDGSVF